MCSFEDHAGQGEESDGLAGCIDLVPRKSIRKNAPGCVQGGDNDEGIEGENNKGINENTDNSDGTLVVRRLDIGLRVRVGRGAHTCLIGEEAALGRISMKKP